MHLQSVRFDGQTVSVRGRDGAICAHTHTLTWARLGGWMFGRWQGLALLASLKQRLMPALGLTSPHKPQPPAGCSCATGFAPSVVCGAAMPWMPWTQGGHEAVSGSRRGVVLGKPSCGQEGKGVCVFSSCPSCCSLLVPQPHRPWQHAVLRQWGSGTLWYFKLSLYGYICSKKINIPFPT